MKVGLVIILLKEKRKSKFGKEEITFDDFDKGM